jgi:two-component system cell cycle sensor histidine kinase/response regulator CckA
MKTVSSNTKSIVHGGDTEPTRQQSDSERTNLQALEHQQQKMEAISTLAGGIAHCFNNLLMGIQGNASLVLLDIDSRHPHYEQLKHIEQQVQSGAEIARQLLGFARGGKYDVRPTNVNELIEKSATAFSRGKPKIQIHRQFQEDVWPVEVDRGQLEQVFLNLFVNAWQAISGEGDLRLQTENVILAETDVSPYKLEPGEFVKISVSDNGIGMDETTQQRVFEPFFTTMGAGKAKGLGLAAAYGIVRNHGGIIRVSSKRGEGTAFEIFLPVSNAKILQDRGFVTPLKSKGTVLLVDGNAPVADVGSQMLKKLGYEVLMAESGQEAVGIYRENTRKIDMVVLDMVTPELSAAEGIYERLRKIDPTVRVLLTTGNGIDSQARRKLEGHGNGFLQKPFTLKQLSEKIAEILNQNS